MRNIPLIIIVLFSACRNNISSTNHYLKAYTEIVDVSDPRIIYPTPESTLQWFGVEDKPDSGYRFSLTYVSDRQQNRRWSYAIPSNTHSSVSLLEGGNQQRNNEIVEWYTQVREAYNSLYREIDTSKSIEHTELINVLLQEVRNLVATDASEKVIVCHSDGQQHMDTKKLLRDELLQALQKQPLPHDCGITLIFVYRAVSLADDKAFTQAVETYRTVLADYGINVKPQAQNDILSK